MIWIIRKRSTAKYHLFQYDFSFCIFFCLVIPNAVRNLRISSYKMLNRFLTAFGMTEFYFMYLFLSLAIKFANNR